MRVRRERWGERGKGEGMINETYVGGRVGFQELAIGLVH
jgi:hypothetical protein